MVESGLCLEEYLNSDLALTGTEGESGSEAPADDGGDRTDDGYDDAEEYDGSDE